MDGSRLSKLMPAVQPCPHVLGRWVLRTNKSTAVYPDGAARPTEHRGGRLVRTGSACVYGPGHRGPHRTEDGQVWT